MNKITLPFMKITTNLTFGYVSNTNKRNRKSHGFTIIELLIAIAVLGILVSLAVPSFKSLLKNSRLSNTASDIAIAINIARNAAIARNE